MKSLAYNNLVKDIEGNFRFIYLNHLKTEDYYFVIIRVNDKHNFFLQAITERGKFLHLEIPSKHYLLKHTYSKRNLINIKNLGWSNVTSFNMHEKDFDIMQTPIKQIAQFAADTIIEIFKYDFKSPLGYEVEYQKNEKDLSRSSHPRKLGYKNMYNLYNKWVYRIFFSD